MNQTDSLVISVTAFKAACTCQLLLLLPDKCMVCLIMELVGNHSFTVTPATADVTTPHRYPSWHPSSSTSASLTCQPPSPESRLCKCIWQQPSNHACWWRLTNSGRAAMQRHDNCRWIPPDVQVKAQYYKSSVGSLHLNNKEDKRELKVIQNNKTLPFCSEPTYLRGMLDRTVTYRWYLKSLHK